MHDVWMGGWRRSLVRPPPRSRLPSATKRLECLSRACRSRDARNFAQLTADHEAAHYHGDVLDNLRAPASDFH